MKSKSIKEYLEEKRANKVKESSLKTIEWVMESMNKIKPLDKCSEGDLKRILTKLEVSEKTMSLYKIYLKNYFRWRGEPDKVAWIKVKKIKTNIQEDSLLTPEEIKSLLDACQSPREASLIAILSESACRISEALNLNIGDLSKTDYGFKMRIRMKLMNKTGPRDIALISSVPHLTQWLNMHPLKKDTNAPLFVSLGSRSHYERMAGHSVRKIMKKIKERAGITKRVHPHIFRHTALTNLANDGMQESILRKFAGWSGSSDMPEIYIHVGNKDVENAQLIRHGKAVAQSHLALSPLTKECPTCHKDIPVDSQFCENCSKHQDLSPVVRRLIEENRNVMERIGKLEETTQLQDTMIKQMEEPKRYNRLSAEEMERLCIIAEELDRIKSNIPPRRLMTEEKMGTEEEKINRVSKWSF